MTHDHPEALRAAAARNNADWCAAVSRSHGRHGRFSEAAWTSARRTPPYYPDAVTLRPDAAPASFLPEVDTASAGCSVKDSFATLDLTRDGFTRLFDAQWIHRPPGLAVAPAPGVRAERVCSARQLQGWQAAWHGEGTAPDVFRPALLEDPSVLVLAVSNGAVLAGGAILNPSTGLVGVSNLFAVDGADASAVWSAALATARDRFPGLPVTGYEHGEALQPALDSGFTPLGLLRVWLHGS